MYKKFSLICALCISLLGLFGTQATAYPPTLPGGTKLCPWCPGSSEPAVIVTADFVGISNTDLKPTDVYVLMVIESGELRALNPAGEDGGIGVPFGNVTIPLYNSAETDKKAVAGRGTWTGVFKWYHADIIQWLINNDFIPDLPALPNKHWSWQLRIYQALLRVTGNTNVSQLCESPATWPPYPYATPPYPYPAQCTAPLSGGSTASMEEVIHNISRCYAPLDEKGNIIFGAYDTCDTLFNWKYKNNSQVCIYVDPNGDDEPCVYDFPANPEDWWNYVPQY
jgi:hypothetical protein